jgi:hypothetical protein
LICAGKSGKTYRENHHAHDFSEYGWPHETTLAARFRAGKSWNSARAPGDFPRANTKPRIWLSS